MNKIFITVAAIAIFFVNINSVSAYETFWHDREAGFTKFAKIVLFPLSNGWEAMDSYQLGGEGTRNFRFNSYLNDRLAKKLPKINFIQLSDEIKEFGDINKNTLGHLLSAYANEQERAAAVEEATMADAYIVPRFRENRIQEDISPRREWDVQLKTWTEERGGPDGYKTYDEKTRVVHHVIPETKIYLHIMQVEFTGYDNHANKVMTSLQQSRSYNVSEESQFQTLADNFRKVFEEARAGKNVGKGASSTIRVGFEPAKLWGDYGKDEYYSNAMDFALQETALKRIDKARVVTVPSISLPLNYKIVSDVTRCDLVPVWHDPSYSVSDVVLSTEEEKWKDDKGKEHTKKITHYDQEINSHYAYWSFHWTLNSSFSLLTPEGSVVLTKAYRENDDKPLDAYRHAADDFCKAVNKQLKKK